MGDTPPQGSYSKHMHQPAKMEQESLASRFDDAAGTNDAAGSSDAAGPGSTPPISGFVPGRDPDGVEKKRFSSQDRKGDTDPRRLNFGEEEEEEDFEELFGQQNAGKRRRTKKSRKPKRGKKSRKPKRGKKSRKTRNTKRTKRR